MAIDVKEYLKPQYHPLLTEKDGIFILLEDDFEEKLTPFLVQFEEINALTNKPKLPTEIYPKLPFGKNDFEWKLRQQTLKIIYKLLFKHKNQLILEVGSWNGWLANRLSGMGHTILATDYFTDEQDGLRAKKFYKNGWAALQMDIESPDILEPVFDIIIINHCLQFQPDPVLFTGRYQKLVKPGGILILSGLSFYIDQSKKAKEVIAYKKHQKEKYNFGFLKDTKALLDKNDLNELEKLGIIFHKYPGMWWRNILALMIPKRPNYVYGVWIKPLFCLTLKNGQ